MDIKKNQKIQKQISIASNFIFMGGEGGGVVQGEDGSSEWSGKYSIKNLIKNPSRKLHVTLIIFLKVKCEYLTMARGQYLRLSNAILLQCKTTQ